MRMLHWLAVRKQMALICWPHSCLLQHGTGHKEMWTTSHQVGVHHAAQAEEWNGPPAVAPAPVPCGVFPGYCLPVGTPCSSLTVAPPPVTAPPQASIHRRLLGQHGVSGHIQWLCCWIGAQLCLLNRVCMLRWHTAVASCGRDGAGRIGS